MTRTSIEWTDCVWNPVRGCSRVSEGCRNCYAERVASRFENGEGPLGSGPFFGFVKDGKWTGDVALIEEKLGEPLRWKKPRRIFVNSMSDLFHENLSDDDIAAVFGIMAAAYHHTFQVLTKRPERMRSWVEKANGFLWPDTIACERLHRMYLTNPPHQAPWPLPNVWLGVSVEDQKTADERIPLLMQTPAAVRFVSYEPALGPVAFTGWIGLRKKYRGADGSGLDWIVAGGESGPGARPAHPDWFRSARDECEAGCLPFFYKQAGEYVHRSNMTDQQHLWWEQHVDNLAGNPQEWFRFGKKRAGRLLDGRTWDEFPGVAR